MSSKKDLIINIIGNREKSEVFDFQVDSDFFAAQDDSLIETGNLKVHLKLSKSISLLKADFSIQGIVRLVCDRSLEEFDYELNIEESVHFKFGPTDEELDTNLIQIHYDTLELDLNYYIYDIIAAALPMKKIHPDYRLPEDEVNFEAEEDEDDEVSRLFASTSSLLDESLEEEVEEDQWNEEEEDDEELTDEELDMLDSMSDDELEAMGRGIDPRWAELLKLTKDDNNNKENKKD